MDIEFIKVSKAKEKVVWIWIKDISRCWYRMKSWRLKVLSNSLSVIVIYLKKLTSWLAK